MRRVRCARDLMRRRVPFLEPDSTLRQAADLFSRERVAGAPVMGPGDRILGYVTEADLRRRERQERLGRVPPFYQEGGRLRIAYRGPADGCPVRELMSRRFSAVEEDAPLAEVARLMERTGGDHIFVIREGRVTGVLSSRDMLRVVAAWPRPRGRPRRAARRRGSRPARARR